MADTKLTGLSTFTPILTDVLYAVDDPGGTPVSGGVINSALLALFQANTDTDDIAEGTNKFATAAQLAKVDHLSVTQAVDLDAIETRVNALDAAIILSGTWDASSGSFPGGGSAQAGESWIVSVAGTVDGVVFAVDDRIIAITDNASTGTFSANWHKADYTDLVQSVAGLTGVISDTGLQAALGLAALAYLSTVGASQIDANAVTGAKILAGAVSLDKHADLVADRIMGRANGAGTGIPQALTPAQIRTLSQVPALAGDTFTGQINFSGTTHAGIKVISLTTTQRNALTPAAGMIIYNSTTGTIEGYDGSQWADALDTSGSGIASVAADTTPQLGGDLDVNGNGLGFLGSNSTGGTLTAGTLVYRDAADNSIDEADADGSGTMPIAGMVSNDIANSASGIVVTHGFVSGVDTSGLSVGDPIYGSATAGAFTGTAPTSGTIQEVGRVVTVHASTGIVYIDIKIGGLPVNDGVSLKDTSDNEVVEYGVTASAVNHPKLSNAATGNAAKIEATGGDTNVDLQLAAKGSGVVKGHNHAIMVAVGDETTDLTTGTAKLTFRMPYAFTLVAVRASVVTAPTGATITVDINEGGSTILSTKLTIDASEKTSATAATAAVISDSALADDAEITIDIDQIGSTVAGAGLKVSLIGYQS